MRISDWSSDVCSSDLRFILPHDGAIFDQINQAEEIAFKVDRKIKNQRTRAQTILDHVNTTLEIRTGAIQLVDETHAGNKLFLRLVPHGFRWRSNTRNAVETSDRTEPNATRGRKRRVSGEKDAERVNHRRDR